MSPTKFDYFLSCKGAHLSKMPLFRHLIFFRNLSRLFQTSNILEVMVSVFKAALVKIHPLNPIHCCFYLTECDGILLAGCIGVQMSHFVCSIPPPTGLLCLRLVETHFLRKIAFHPSARTGSSHSYPETQASHNPPPMENSARDVNNQFINNSKTACVSHLHTKQHPIFSELLLVGFVSSSGQPPVNMEAFIVIQGQENLPET